MEDPGVESQSRASFCRRKVPYVFPCQTSKWPNIQRDPSHPRVWCLDYGDRSYIVVFVCGAARYQGPGNEPSVARLELNQTVK